MTGLRLVSRGPDDTRAIGAAAAPVLRPGDVVALTGDLGAGKTCLVQGIAQGLGVRGRVTSPTFALVRTYPDARVPLVHCDVYRLDRLADVATLGDDVLDEDHLTVVEWGEAVAAVLPSDRFVVTIHLDPDDEDTRTIAVACRGRTARRCDVLRAQWSGWLDDEGG